MDPMMCWATDVKEMSILLDMHCSLHNSTAVACSAEAYAEAEVAAGGQ